MVTKIFFVLGLLCGILICQARHIHPSKTTENLIKLEDGNNNEPIALNHNTMLTRFVPLNKPSFFKIFESCKDGFKRDALGICREVWD